MASQTDQSQPMGTGGELHNTAVHQDTALILHTPSSKQICSPDSMTPLLMQTTPSCFKFEKELRINRPKPFTGKRQELRGFIQDIQVYLLVNKRVYDTDLKKIIFMLSFMDGGFAAMWKERVVGEALEEADKKNIDLNFGKFKDFVKLIVKDFGPYYDESYGVLREMENLRMGDTPADDHIATFRMLVIKSGLKADSKAVIHLYKETLDIRLQRKILLLDNPPTKLEGWYERTSREEMLKRIIQRSRNTGSVERKNLNLDKMTVEERTTLMKRGACFKCRQVGHLSRHCPGDGK